MHLIIDGYSANPDILKSEEFIYRWLDQYPAEIGMTKISSPYVVRYVGAKPEDWGLSGLVLIAESHISIHTFVEPGFVNIDVFSCKSFDAEQVIKDISNRFELTGIKTHLLGRAMEDVGCPAGAGGIASIKQ